MGPFFFHVATISIDVSSQFPHDYRSGSEVMNGELVVELF